MYCTETKNRILKQLVLTGFKISTKPHIVSVAKRGPKKTKIKINITVDPDFLEKLDKHIDGLEVRNRSGLINQLIKDFLDTQK